MTSPSAFSPDAAPPLADDAPYDGRAAWDALYDPADERAIWGADPAPYVVDDAAALWRADGARRILALPSGDGRNILPLLAEFPGIVAADSSPNALQLLTKRTQAAGLSTPEMAVQDVYAPNYPAEAFDSVLCWDLLSHLERPEAALQALLGLVRRGGSLITNLFAADDPSLRDDSMVELAPNVLANAEGIVYWLYDADAARALAARTGGADAKVAKISWWEPPHPGYREYEHQHLGYALTVRRG
jgi:SAM-dependent methyltransferase